MGIIALNQDEIKVVSAGVSLVGLLSLWGFGAAGFIGANFLKSRKHRGSITTLGIFVVAGICASAGLFLAEKIVNIYKNKNSPTLATVDSGALRTAIEAEENPL